MRRVAIAVMVMLVGLSFAAPALAQTPGGSGDGFDETDVLPDTEVLPDDPGTNGTNGDTGVLDDSDVAIADTAGDETAVLGSQLAQTGVNVTVGMLLAAGLLLAGGVMLVVARRRRGTIESP